MKAAKTHLSTLMRGTAALFDSNYSTHKTFPMRHFLRIQIALAFMIFMLGADINAQSCNPDITPPTPFCQSISVGFENGSSTLVWARDFDAGSMDNCSAPDDLIFSFDAAKTSLNKRYNALGTYVETMVVTDEAGNQDSCLVEILVINCTQSLACQGEVRVFLDPGQTQTLSPENLLAGGPYCESAQFSFSDTDPNDTLYTVNGNDVFPFNLVVYDLSTSNSCWSTVINCANDNVLPVAISEQYLTVSLDPDGQFYVQADMIDQGSYDNCSPVDTDIRRLNSKGNCELPTDEFRRDLLVCCRDIGDTIVVELRVRDEAGNENFAFTEVIVTNKINNNLECARISGKVYIDDNDNCQYDNGEPSAYDINVIATDGVDEYVGTVDNNGNYYIFAPYGTYDLFVVSPGLYWAVCPVLPSVTLNDTNDDASQDFGLTESVDCPLMTVDLSAARLRRCFDNRVIMDYSNQGPATATDASIILTLDDGLFISSSAHPYVDLGQNSYEFDLGDVESFESGEIKILVHVDCNSTAIGETKCMEANIFPDSICIELLEWSGANVEVSGECKGDSLTFSVTNTGTDDMAMERMLSIIEDDIVLFMQGFKLDKNQSLSRTVEATGSTFRFNAEQEVNHPYPGIKSIAIEGCTDNPTGGVSLGFIQQFSAGDSDPFTDIECLELIGSYDPNEKTASPIGYGNDHNILPGEPISYTLYFQNTGTDTAFNVFLLDTLSDHLDHSTFKAGPSSHDYTFDWLENGTIRFNFDDIMLPDSFVNEPASNGFVKFTILPKTDLPLPTRIENTAGIYFDFNEAVVTNTVFHTVDTGFFKSTTSIPWIDRALRSVQIMPNPVRNIFRIDVSGEAVEHGQWTLSNIIGQRLNGGNFKGNRISSDISSLSAGVYIYHIYENTQLIATGRIVKDPKE